LSHTRTGINYTNMAIIRYMHQQVDTFLQALSLGKTGVKLSEDGREGVITVLAKAYERARNALEYRADHLIRRAATERILKRHIMFDRNVDVLADHLLRELSWARYLSKAEVELVSKDELKKVMSKYVGNLDSGLPYDWIVGMASAEIEELFNLNVDYRLFTNFAFQLLRQKVKLTEEIIDLLLFVAVDRVYSQSDDQQVAYHILKIVGDFKEAYRLFNLAKSHRLMHRLMRFVRENMSAPVLLRDIYFSNPADFKELIGNEELFRQRGKEVLTVQLRHASGRISTAATRSIIYVFLTKMIFGFGIEVPLDRLLYGEIAKIPVAVNLIFPPILMWLSTTGIAFPNRTEQERLVERTWRVISEFEVVGIEDESWEVEPTKKFGFWYLIFTALYTVMFVVIFGGIFYLLTALHFSIASQGIFVFFLCVVAFFAYRIRQSAQVYRVRSGRPGTTLWDMVLLPVLSAGNKMSQGLSKLNVLVFAFDFILEAPFKIILRFLDDWVQYLTMMKDEVTG